MAKGFDVAKKEVLTTHWIEKGSKEGLDAECSGTSTVQERLSLMQQNAYLESLKDLGKRVCDSKNRFWDEEKQVCDGLRNKDGSSNTYAETCKENNGYWDSEGKVSFCNPYFNSEKQLKSKKERCNFIGSFWDESKPGNECNPFKNVNGRNKKYGDLCVAMNNYYIPPKKNEVQGTCDIERTRDGKPKTEEQMCNDEASFYGNRFWIEEAWYGEGGNKINVLNQIREMVRFGYNQDTEDDYVRECYAAWNPDVENSLATFGKPEEYKKVWDHWINHGQKEGRYSSCGENALIIPSFPVDWFVRTKLNGADPAPGKTKMLEVRCQGNKYAFAFDGDYFPGIKLQYGTEKFCNQDYFPNGLVKSRDFIKDVVDVNLGKDQMAMFGWERGTIGRLPYNYNTMHTYLKNVNNNNEFYANAWKKDDESDIQPPRGTGKSKSLTLYYADWCPHCHDMMPEWNKLGKQHKGIKVEKFEEKETDFKVNGFPTIIFRDGSKVEKYEGKRNKNAIVSYLKNKLK